MMQKNSTKPESYIEVQRIFIRNLSLETPHDSYATQEEWHPEVSLNLETKNNRVQENQHEVILSITATVTSLQKTVFLIEVQQAGLFLIKGFVKEALNHLLGSYCPSILFPYARAVTGSTVMLAGFPQLILAHVNFDALYAQHLQQTQNKESATKQDSSSIHDD